MPILSVVKHHLEKYWAAFLLLAILSLAVAIRFNNLNYNSPFNDEASDILIGKLGVFQHDWWSYNPSAWLAGSPYAYPVITALASSIGGVIGSRFLNAVLGVLSIEAVFVLSLNIFRFENQTQKYIAGLVSAALVAGSPIAVYISRLATYDMPSYFIFLWSLITVLMASRSTNPGRLYFYSSFLLFLSIMMKIIVGIYVPFLVIFTYFLSKNSPLSRQYHFWKYYYFIPLILLLGLYGLFNFHSILIYAGVNIGREKVPYTYIFNTIWLNSGQIILAGLSSSIIMLFSGHKKTLFLLLFAALLIISPHLLSQRAILTMEKELFLTEVFMSLVIGWSVSKIIFSFNYVWQPLAVIPIIFLIFNYWFYTSRMSARFNHMWANSNQAVAFLSGKINSGDKVLVESGGTAILAGYNKNPPTNYVTFDWFNYDGATGESAYTQAVKDGYFKYIELEGIGQQGDTIFKKYHDLIASSALGLYSPVFSQQGFVIYARNF